MCVCECVCGCTSVHVCMCTCVYEETGGGYLMSSSLFSLLYTLETGFLNEPETLASLNSRDPSVSGPNTWVMGTRGHVQLWVRAKDLNAGFHAQAFASEKGNRGADRSNQLN